MAEDNFDINDFTEGPEVELTINVNPIANALATLPFRCDGWERAPHDTHEVAGISIHLYGDGDMQETLVYCDECLAH